MWNGKNKAITFSFDDGVTQDKRLVEMLDKYGLKATFNINSSILGFPGELQLDGKAVRHDKVHASEVKSIYAGHEAAAHTLIHPLLPTLDDEAVVWQVEQDRKTLSELCGYEVRCMAYPGGGVNNDERVAKLVKEHTGIKLARTIVSTYNFDMQTDLIRFNPSVHWCEADKMFELGEKFLALKADKPQLYYVWGHSYELDGGTIVWDKFEEFCKIVAHKEDIFYGTNSECLFE